MMPKNKFGESYDKAPSIRDAYPYVLLALYSFGGKAHRGEVIDKVAKFVELSEEVMNEVTLQNKRKKYYMNCAFASSKLRKVGFIRSSQDTQGRGYWEITERGKQEVKILIQQVESFMESGEPSQVFVEFRDLVDKEYRAYRKDKQESAPQDDADEDELEADDDQSQEQVEEEADIAALEQIRQMDPYAFELLCLGLLKEMGFKIEGTSKSRDHGIDGVGYVRIELISFKTVMQAKRYAEDNRVGERDMRNFLGAKQDTHAEKGIFITTSTFSRAAEELAEKHSITLIDGNGLIELMKDNKIGYKLRLNLDDF